MSRRLVLLETISGHNRAHVAQLVEHILGKDEVSGSIPLMGSSSWVEKERRTNIAKARGVHHG